MRQLRRRIDPWYRSHRRLSQASAVTAFAAAAVAVLAGLALASSPTTLSLRRGVRVKSKIDTLVVTSRGLTVYTLSGERVHHLKCTKASGCLAVWPPVTAGSGHRRLTAAHGIKGKLGTLRRNGFRQVTLGGRPLYTFVGDSGKKGRATGEGIHHFGGTWHVIATSSASAPAMPGPTTTTTSTTYTSPYSY